MVLLSVSKWCGPLVRLQLEFGFGAVSGGSWSASAGTAHAARAPYSLGSRFAVATVSAVLLAAGSCVIVASVDIARRGCAFAVAVTADGCVGIARRGCAFAVAVASVGIIVEPIDVARRGCVRRGAVTSAGLVTGAFELYEPKPGGHDAGARGGRIPGKYCGK